MDKLLYIFCIIVVTFWYVLFTDGTSLDFIERMIDNIIEIGVFISLMSIIAYFLFYILKNIKFNKKKNSDVLNTKTVSIYNDNPLNFCEECDKNQNTENKYNSYCKSVHNLYELIKDTSKDISYKSIAVTGEWGSGKSSVLNGLKKLLEKEYDRYVVIFIDVWKYKEISQIITALENKLNNKFKNGSFFVTSYFNLIASWYEKELFLSQLMPTETQEEFSQRISKQLGNKRLIIMIDEIDRIVDKSELMEILKLIKVHSNIEKTTIVTALSQKHFLKTMNEIDPKYLQKYFYYTFPIPSFSQKEFLRHNHKILQSWEEMSNDCLKKAYWALRGDEYFKKEVWKYFNNHRETKETLVLLKQTLESILNTSTIIQDQKIIEKYSIVCFYISLLHTINLGLYLQLEYVDEKNENEIIKNILEHVSLSDFKHMLTEFKKRKVEYGSHPWFLISYYIDKGQYYTKFDQLHTSQEFYTREHYKLLLENITFAQLKSIKSYLPYFLNVAEWVYQAIENLNKHKEFKDLVINGFNSYNGKERLKKIAKFINDIENQDFDKWNDITWNDFKENIIEDINNVDFLRETFNNIKISKKKKNELKELLRSYFEHDTQKWIEIESKIDGFVPID